MTSTLDIFSDDASLYNTIFELTISSTVNEELTWANTTNIKIVFLKPPCQVTQAEINAVSDSISTVYLNAAKFFS